VIFPRSLPAPVAVIFHFSKCSFFLLFQFPGELVFLLFGFPFRVSAVCDFVSFSAQLKNWVSFRVSALTIDHSRLEN